MAKAEARRNTRVYHGIVAILILLSGAALLGIGIWLRFTDNGDLFDLDYSSNNTLSVILRTDVGAMIIGSFLIISGIVSLIALSKNCVGITFRVIYFIMGFIIFVVLLAVLVASCLFLTRADDPNIRTFFSDAWETTVQHPKEFVVICQIEKSFQCRGFEDNDCTTCPTGLDAGCPTERLRCATCGNTNPDSNPSEGCYSKITTNFRNVFLPLAIVSGILAVVVLVDIIFLFCL